MTANFEIMPLSLSQKLLGLTVNEALQQGIITNVGDEQGNFIFSDGEVPNLYYAVVNGYLIHCSENVVNVQVPIDTVAGGLLFYKHFHNGEETLKLGLSNSVKLGKVVYQINKAD